MTVDEKRGIVFASTGSPSFDFWGGDRIGKNLYGDCVLAIDAVTGRLRWHYQTLYHDLWDRDLPAPPNLVTLDREGRRIDAVAQVTKLGVVFVLDRDTGEPLFPVEERPVPASDLEGEEAWPTQPFPLKPPPFSRLSFTEADVTDLSPRAREAVLERFRQVPDGTHLRAPQHAGDAGLSRVQRRRRMGRRGLRRLERPVVRQLQRDPVDPDHDLDQGPPAAGAVRRFPRLPGPLCELPWGPAARESPPL